MEDQNNIRVILSDKAEITLEEIISNFNLQNDEQSQNESPDVIIDQLIKDFAKGSLLESNFVASLQNELKIPEETAKKLSKEILTKVVPMLEKFPEEKFKDPDFADALSEKIFREQTIENKSSDTLLKTEPLVPVGVAEIFKKNTPSSEKEPKNETVPLPRKQEKFKKPIVLEKITEKIKQPRIPNKYREPIE
ncbi:MAG: hypothetical protein HY005_02310 [Candidatus Staskawiczbacteria bacterium]|nr:hypothetical protein [Candidatus Staskawiczbacteria bacterium]